MYEYKGIEYLRKKLEHKRLFVLDKYKYYELKNATLDFKHSVIPDEFKNFEVSLGWCAKAVDCISDRLIFEGFKNDNLNLNEIFNMNNKNILTKQGNKSALISACSFVYISPDEDGYPRLQVIDGGNATGILDPITNLLYEGYAVLNRDKNGEPNLEAHFTTEYTAYYEIKKPVAMMKNPAPYALLVPIINAPDAVKVFGHSQISRACISITQSALRTLKRADISSEFYSFPQKYLLGTENGAEPDTDEDDEEGENKKTWNGVHATLSAFLNISEGENGSKPTVGQFAQQSMAPFVEQMRMYAALFSGETGLTLDDLGFPSDNPSSAETIKSAHETLRLKARNAQGDFGTGYLNVGYLAACVRDNYAWNRAVIYLTSPVWKPIFEPDMSTLSSFGDGVIKINQAIPGTITKEVVKEMTGLDIAIEDVRDIDNIEGGDAFD